MEALQTTEENLDEKPETRNEARSILKKMQKLDNVLLTEIWSKILSRFNEASKTVQNGSLPLDVGLKLIDSLIGFVKHERENFDRYEAIFKEKFPDYEYKNLSTRTRTRSSRVRFFDGEAVELLSAGAKFKVEVYLPIVDSLICKLKERSKAYSEISDLFGFFSRLKLIQPDELKLHCQHFSQFYNDDVNGEELEIECQHLKHYLIEEDMLDDHIPLIEIYNLLKNNKLDDTSPNIEISLRIFLSMMITNCSSERSFSKLKLIENELRSSMTQERLSCLSIMSIEYDVLQDIDFKSIIDDFASAKIRRKPM